MTKDPTTFGVDPKCLAHLFGLGLAGDQDDDFSSGPARSELISAYFAGPLPPSRSVILALPALLGALRKELLPEGGRPLAEILTDPDTPLDVIEKIKSHGKGLATHDEPYRSIGIAVYYTSIASALVFHGKKITKHSYAYLRDSLSMPDKSWMTPPIDRHIAKAVRICRKRAK